MKLENRYEVKKLKTGELVDCLVIEKDWPEYEPTLALLSSRVDGTQSHSGGEAVGEVGKSYRDVGGRSASIIWFTPNGDPPNEGTELYLTSPDQSERITELEAALINSRQTITNLNACCDRRDDQIIKLEAANTELGEQLHTMKNLVVSTMMRSSSKTKREILDEIDRIIDK